MFSLHRIQNGTKLIIPNSLGYLLFLKLCWHNPLSIYCEDKHFDAYILVNIEKGLSLLNFKFSIICFSKHN